MEDSMQYDLGMKPINGTVEGSPPQTEGRLPSDGDYRRALLADEQRESK